MFNEIKKDVRTISRGVIAHGVNTAGVMKSGIAYAIAQAFPNVLAPYQRRCANNPVIGEWVSVTIGKELFVVNIFTQTLYGFANLDAISAGVTAAAELANTLKLPLYTPMIGTLRGGRDWFTEVKPIYENIAEMYPSLEWCVINT